MLLLLCYYFVVLVIGEVSKTTPVNTPLLLNILSSAFSGVVELTTQLLRLISILWLPLCRINKLGLYLPANIVSIPYTCGLSAACAIGCARCCHLCWFICVIFLCDYLGCRWLCFD